MDKEETFSETLPNFRNEAESKLYDYLLQGIYRNIRECNIAQSISDEISKNADAINKNSYARFFFEVQCAFAKQDAIEVAKMFDPVSRNKEYKTRSIPNILNHLKDKVDFFILHDRTILTDIFVKAGCEPTEIQSWNDGELILQLVKHYDQELKDENSRLYEVLQIVKTYRDKRVAHNEDVIDPTALTPLWDHSKYLCAYADKFASLILLTILGTYSSNIGSAGKGIASIVGPIVSQLKPLNEAVADMRRI